MTKKNKAVILVAARIKSTRLPAKAVTKIEGKTAIEHLLDRLKLANVVMNLLCERVWARNEQ